MMLRCIKQIFAGAVIIIVCCNLSISCGKHKKQEYSYRSNGYYYKLLSFNTDTFHYQQGYMSQLSVVFSTQHDSIFWDSYNNLNDHFFIKTDSSARHNFFKQCASVSAIGDSVCLLIKTNDFFIQQFQSSQIPFFSKGDSVVKVHFKVKQILSSGEFEAITFNLRKKEQEQIRNFYKSTADYKAAKDSLGFFWVLKPAPSAGDKTKPGSLITLSYRGYYLNGRFLEASPEKFELVYRAPDQLLKGLNYVIGRIKVGQNTKIILPSRLAFGENGSANGTVPPYTPLLYEIKITNIK